MKIVVQQDGTGRYLKRYPEWVPFKEKARTFRDVASAIKHCLSVGVRDVRLSVFSDTWQLESHVKPFGATGLDLSNKAMVTELRKSIEENRALREKQCELKIQLDRVAAGLKERKKQRPFTRKPVSDNPPQSAS